MSPEDFIGLLGDIPGRLEQASFREPLNQAGYEFGEQVGQNFSRQVSSDGSPWPPHAPLTVRLHGPHPLLRLTWAMYAAATNPDDSAAKKILEDRQITLGIDGNEIPYAVKQNEGEGRIPQREFFYLSEEGEVAVRDILADASGPIMDKEVFR